MPLKYTYTESIKPKVNLKKELKEKKLTYRDIEKLAGVDHSDMSKLISGKKRYNEVSLTKLAQLLECSTDYLLDRTQERLVNKGFTKEEIEKIVFDKYANTLIKRKAIEIISQLNERQAQAILNVLKNIKRINKG